MKQDQLIRERYAKILLPYIFKTSCCVNDLNRLWQKPYDLDKNGFYPPIEKLASADLLLISGPCKKNLLNDYKKSFNNLKSSVKVIVIGNCFLGKLPDQISWSEVRPVDLFIEGCPPSLQEIKNQLVAFKNALLPAEKTLEIL